MLVDTQMLLESQGNKYIFYTSLALFSIFPFVTKKDVESPKR